MKTGKIQNVIALAVFGLILLVIVMLAFSSTTWAAPGAQGTVPTAPAPTPGNNGGGNNGGDKNKNNNNNNDNGGGDNSGTLNSGSDSTGGGASAAPAGPGAGSVCAIGDNGAQCTATDLVIVVGPGAATAGSALTIEGSFPQPPCPPSSAGQNFLDRCYRFTWIGTNAQPLDAINAPVQYCISYGEQQLAVVKNNPNAFLIGLAGADGNWTMLKPTADPAGNRTCATSNQLIVWSALFAPKSSSDLLPTVGAPENNWWLAALAGFGAVLILVAARLRRAR